MYTGQSLDQTSVFQLKQWEAIAEHHLGRQLQHLRSKASILEQVSELCITETTHNYQKTKCTLINTEPRLFLMRCLALSHKLSVCHWHLIALWLSSAALVLQGAKTTFLYQISFSFSLYRTSSSSEVAYFLLFLSLYLVLVLPL